MVRFSTFILHPLVPGGRVFFELEGAWMATLLHELTRGRTAAAGERSTEEAARSLHAGMAALLTHFRRQIAWQILQ